MIDIDFKELIESIDELPLFKNSDSYESKDWRKWEEVTVSRPVQRKLTRRECVFDLDDVAPIHFEMIPHFLKETGLKFIAWKSGPTGMHIHFWTQVTGKEQKRQVVKYMSTKIEELFGVKNDLKPMGHECIRTEGSIHPFKKYEKTFLTSNISTLFPINDLPDSLIEKVGEIDLSAGQITPNNHSIDGKKPSCVKYILGHKFNDGRERMIFSLISWFKAEGLTPKEIFDNVYSWCKEQNYTISPRVIQSKIHSNSGKVGCAFRHEILEELGVDMSKCCYEK